MNKDAVVRQSRLLRTGVLLVAIAALACCAAPCAVAASDPASCAASVDSRQLDFWLGDWTVTYPGAPAASNSKVHLELDKCLLVESWVGGKAHAGENMFAYSSDDKRWHGMFADNEGRVHVFQGIVSPGSAEFFGPSTGPDGRTILNRIKVVRINADNVQQTWEKSSDNGATWTMEFRGDYSRKRP